MIEVNFVTLLPCIKILDHFKSIKNHQEQKLVQEIIYNLAQSFAPKGVLMSFE